MDQAHRNGVSLGAYAKVRAALADGISLDEACAFAEIESASWAAASENWETSLRADPIVKKAFDHEVELAEDALARSISPLDSDLAAFTAFEFLFKGQVLPDQFLKRFGMVSADMSRLTRLWQRRIRDDDALALEAKELAEAPPDDFPEVVVGARKSASKEVGQNKKDSATPPPFFGPPAKQGTPPNQPARPSYLASQALAAHSGVAHLGVSIVVAPQPLDASLPRAVQQTLDLSGILTDAEPLPFAGKIAQIAHAPAEPQAQSGFTQDLTEQAEAAFSERQPISDANASDVKQAEPALPTLSLGQYASLAVELQLSPEREAEILLRYQVPITERARLEAAWRARLATAPDESTQYATAFETYRWWLLANKPTVAMSIEAFAGLAAELHKSPSERVEILRRYRLSERDKTHLDLGFAKMFTSDPKAKIAFEKAQQLRWAWLHKKT